MPNVDKDLWQDLLDLESPGPYLTDASAIRMHGCIIDNRGGAAGGKASVRSRTPGLRENEDGSFFMLLNLETALMGWEANHVQTRGGRGWFPYLRAYGAEASLFDGSFRYPTIRRVSDLSGLDYV